MSVQYSYEDFEHFKYNYSSLYPYAKIIGIGNLCKSRNMGFLKQVIDYIINNNSKNKWIHFFGLYKPAVKYLAQFRLPFEVSVDSMKWDYGMHTDRTGDKNTRQARWYNFLQYYKDVLPENKYRFWGFGSYPHVHILHPGFTSLGKIRTIPSFSS